MTVDGPAGSGKSTFAARLGAALGDSGAVVHLDDLYGGWDDLEGVWPRVEEWVLEPIAAGRPGRMRVYDWAVARFGETWQQVPGRPVLVLEGVGSGRRAAADRTTLSVYVDAPAELRLRRGLERDGEALRDEWLRWTVAEEAHFDAERTRARAQLVVDGAATDPGPDAFAVGADRRLTTLDR